MLILLLFILKLLRVCVRSPLIPARPALSSASGSETPGTEIWTNPQDSQDERDVRFFSLYGCNRDQRRLLIYFKFF